MLIDNMFARDMYQVYDINDDDNNNETKKITSKLNTNANYCRIYNCN